MDNVTATNYCAYCFKFVDESTLKSVTFNNHITMPIPFRFCPACFARMAAGDEELKNTMWERYNIVLSHAEQDVLEQIEKRGVNVM